MNKEFWEVMRDNWRIYLNKKKRGSFVHVAASMGGHNGAGWKRRKCLMRRESTIPMPLTFLITILKIRFG